MDHPNTVFISPLIRRPLKDVLQSTPPLHNLEHNKNIWTLVASVDIDRQKTFPACSALNRNEEEYSWWVSSRLRLPGSTASLSLVLYELPQGRRVLQVLPICTYYNETVY